jgi:molybdate transport system substrate-binding protein
MNMRQFSRRISILIIALLLASLITTSAHAQTRTTLTVFAAASLTDAFKEIKTAFEADNKDVEIVYSFGGSSALATQLKEGAPADIFASANNTQMKVAFDAQRIAGQPRTFARNRLVLIVPADNPAKITGLKDLANAGVKLVIAAPKVPVRDYTDAMLEKLAKQADFGTAYKDAFQKNIVSEEDNVRQVSAKIALGEADAGIVYRSDVTPDIGDKVLFFDIPDAVNTLASYPIAITDNTPNPDAAKKYVDFILSDAGQKILVRWNFIGGKCEPAATPAATQAATQAPTQAATAPATPAGTPIAPPCEPD